MDMHVLMVLQIIILIAAYSLIFIGLPAWVLHDRLKHHRFAERFLIYITVGNVVITNLVFLLELLHISNFVTLVAGTALIVILGHRHFNRDLWANRWQSVRGNAMELSVGTRTLKQLSVVNRAKLKSSLFVLLDSVRKNFIYIIFFVVTMVFVLYVSGTEFYVNFAYKAPDSAVHNYWINALGDNQPFVKGVYPMGFHTVIYYLHAVFQIPVFMMLQVTGIFQILFTVFIFLAFTNLVCRNRYAGFIGVWFFGVFFMHDNYNFVRYLYGIPEEYGQLFVLPSIYFIFRLIEKYTVKLEKKPKHVKPKKVKEKKIIPYGEKRHRLREFGAFLLRVRDYILSRDPLIYVAAGACSLLISVHFYNAFIFAMYAVAMLIGFFPRIFFPRCILRILKTALIAVILAVWPMLAAYIGGTDLQGSLRWGLGVINQSRAELDMPEEEEEESDLSEAEQILASMKFYDLDGNEITKDEAEALYNVDYDATILKINEDDESVPGASGSGKKKREKSLVEKYLAPDAELMEVLKECGYYELSDTERAALPFIPVVSLILSLLLILDLPHRNERWPNICAGIVMSIGTFLLFFMIIAGDFHLPHLMEDYRICAHLEMLLPVCVVMAADAFCSLIMLFVTKQLWLRSLVSLVIEVGLVCFGVYWFGIQKPYNINSMSYNGNITALTNIIFSNPVDTYTVVSANEEYRMVEDYGRHYELSTFLEDMEEKGVAKDYQIEKVVRPEIAIIPTEKVYFFIEKQSRYYGDTFAQMGVKNVSPEYAAEELPDQGKMVYWDKNRFIEMSRMYYWAKEYARLNPGIMTVFYEDPQIVVYEVDQQQDNFRNFAIDYGYNRWTEERAERMQAELDEDKQMDIEAGIYEEKKEEEK